MGWDFGPRDPNQSDIDFARQQYGADLVLDAQSYRGTLYVAWKDVSGKVIALVVLTKKRGPYLGKPPGWYWFGTKVMDETWAPLQAECPKRILEQLDPLDDRIDPREYGRQWRKRCQ